MCTCCVSLLCAAAVVRNMKSLSGTTWITVYWSRPLNAPYLDTIVEYVAAISEKFTSSLGT